MSIASNAATDFRNAHTDFGASAAIVGAATLVTGIFDAEYADMDGAIAGTQPSFECNTADLAGVVRGAAVIINGVAYTIEKPFQHDGTGRTRLLLQKT